MDNGVKFAINNMEKTLEIIEQHPEYEWLKKRIIREFYFLKAIKKTGNLYEHFLKFKSNTHKYANDFTFLNNYGIITNENMADYLEKHYPDELNNFCTVEDLIINNVYTNNEIRSIFKCSDMGGMRRSKETNTLVLIAKHNNPLYDDTWEEDGILNYTGMGKNGDQSINYGQNKTLAMSNTIDIKIYLFESYIDNEYYYRGQVYLCGPVKIADELDESDKLRKVIKFPLRRIDESHKIYVSETEIEVSEKEKFKQVKVQTTKEIKEKAELADSKPIVKEVISIYRERNQYISEYTKRRANGICDLCGKEAPFFDGKGSPYLETHHVITLAEGGPDAIYNTVALCPNCHRKMHVLKSNKDLKRITNVLYNYLLTDDEKDKLSEFNKLFEEDKK